MSEDSRQGAMRSPVVRFFSADNRYLPPVFITLILLVSQISFGLLESLSRTLLAITASVLCEVLLAGLLYKKIPHLASAYITGISVGILLRSPAFWPYALCSVLAIMSKYVIRWRGRHLWNPSNFAISAMLLIVPEYVATLSVQWGNTVWPMLVVWGLGVLIVLRVKRFHITATYVISFIALSFLRSLITGHPFLAEVAPITGPMYQLFIFFMITDPRTTVKPRWAQCLVAFLVAVVEMILRLFENVHAPYYALAVVGPIANVVEIVITSKRHQLGVSKGLVAA
ncbi:MAG: RnfABCDGE type electron transport complex subunit D [Acidobacteriota bacterium]|nr:RnfABCDGE type electron transport complex subunit D [Acidobacteriota bacterium]